MADRRESHPFDVRPVESLADERDRRAIEEAEQMRATGKRVKALRGATDGALAIYTPAEAGPAWFGTSQSRPNYSVRGQIVVSVILAAICAAVIYAATQGDDEVRGVLWTLTGCVAAVWVMSAAILAWSLCSRRVRRKRNLDDPLPGEGAPRRL